MEIPHEQKSTGRPWLKPVLLFACLFAALLAARFFHLGDKLSVAKEWIASLGSWGPIAFIVIYIVAAAAMIPGTILTVSAGALFGGVPGVMYVSIASTTVAALCFVIARYIARDAVKAWLADKPSFSHLDDMTERQGVWVVAVVRLVPLFPFNLVNYAFGLTRVGFWSYVITSWLCMLPGTTVYVVGADSVVQVLSGGAIPWLWIGVSLGLLIVLGYVGVVLKRKIRAPEQKG